MARGRPARGTARSRPMTSLRSDDQTAPPPLVPGPPARLPRVLRTGATGGGIPLWLRVTATVIVTVALGTWGYLELATQPRLTFIESLYAAIKLYTLDLGPGNGSSPGPDWQILVGLVLAAALLARGLLALARSRIVRFIARHRLRGHVIICGAGVYGRRLAETLGADHDVVLVDVTPDSPGMSPSAAAHLWNLTGDAVAEGTLVSAGLARAHWVVAVTGEDFVNSQIVSAVRAVAVRAAVRNGLQLLVQVEDPSLARFLEEAEGGQTRVAVTPFSAEAIAAEALLEDAMVTGRDGDAPLMAMRDGAGPNLLLAGDHPLLEALVLAALRRWRVRTLRELESASGRVRPPMHVSLYGPGAEARMTRLRARWRPEPEVLVLEARDSPPPGEPPGESELWLRRPGRADHAFVACASELDGIALTLTVARALGGTGRVTRVTAQLESALDTHLEQRTAASDELASTEVKSVAELGARPDRMQRLTELERLEAALLSGGARAPAEARASAAARARGVLAVRALEVVSDSGWRVRPAERPLLGALLAVPGVTPPVPLSAIIRAGLRIELDTPENLRAAAERLSAAGDGAAVNAWCAYVHRLAQRPLDEQHAALAGLPALVLSGGTGVGLPAIAARVARRQGLDLIGYVPAGEGDAGLYDDLRETPGATDFSVREPLRMWTDVLAAGVAAAQVRLLACPGGPITAQEMLLARALGAAVGYLDPAGDAPVALDDLLVAGASGVLELPADPMTVRAFVAPSRLDDELRERIARHLHREYRRRHRGRKAGGDPSLAPWEELLPALKASNRAQADDIPNKLTLLGKRLTREGGPLELSAAQIELLAEVEHGRWNAERLADGWRAGQRQTEHRTTPNLRAWAELADEVRDYDREAVSDLPAALADTGWGVVDA